MKKRLWIAFFGTALFLVLCLCGCSSHELDADTMHAELDAFILEQAENGTLDELMDYWIDHADDGRSLDLTALSGERGTIRCGTKVIVPFAFTQNDEWTGLTIELIYRFCEEYGYGLEIESFTDTNSQIVAVVSDRLDIAAANISITEERKKSVDFSPAFYSNKRTFVIRTEDLGLFETKEDFRAVSIATLTGGSIPDVIRAEWPDADVQEYNSVADMCIALSQKKIDSICFDEPTIAIAIKQFPDLSLSGIHFSDRDDFGIVYPKSDESSSGDFVSAFRRTMIDDNRWQLFLKGVGNTLLITVSSILLGSILGFLIYLLCRRRGKLINGITRVCIWIIDGLPVVVFLMILYYVVFESLNLSNLLVSVIAFTLIFASAVFGMLQNAVSAIDRGQYEVSYALGYSEKQTLYKMILPQALRLFWLPCRGAVKTQIKATAIVGYIAATDLTKAGDMIRSSTYEAFFPLIITALLYFLLGAVLAKLVDLIRIQTAPSAKKSEAYLKSVERR